MPQGNHALLAPLQQSGAPAASLPDEWFVVSGAQKIPTAPMKLELKDVFVFLVAMKNTTLSSSRAFLSGMSGYWLQMLPTALPLLSDIVWHPDRLAFFPATKKIIREDVLPVFLAWYCYQAVEDALPKNILTRAALFSFYLAVMAFSLFRALQFYLHKGLISLELSRNTFDFSKINHAAMAQKSQVPNLQAMHAALCANCTTFRVIKGVFRSLLFFIARQAFFDILDRIPVVSTLTYPVVLPLSILMTGQDAFDFRLSEQYCERHVRVNLRQYPELFFMFGLSHYLLVQSWMLGIQYARAGIADFLINRIFGDVFLISSLIQTFGSMSTDFLHRYISGIAFLFFVGLACYFPFPKMVSESTRYSPEFGTYWIADKLIDFVTTELKKATRADEKREGEDFDAEDAKDDEAFFSRERFKKGLLGLKNYIGSSLYAMRYGREAFVQSCEMPHVIQLYDSVLLNIALLRYKTMAVLDLLAINESRANFLIKTFLPKNLRSRQDFLDDAIFQQYSLKTLSRFYAVVCSALKSREAIVGYAELVTRINAISTNQGVTLLCWVFRLGTIRQMLTFEFIVNDSPRYVATMPKVLESLRRWRFISKEHYLKHKEALVHFKKNIALLRQLLKELSEDSLNAFIVFLRSDGCVQRLTDLKAVLVDCLAQHPAGITLLEDEDKPKPAVVEEPASPVAAAAQPAASMKHITTESDFDMVVEHPVKPALEDFDVVEALARGTKVVFQEDGEVASIEGPMPPTPAAAHPIREVMPGFVEVSPSLRQFVGEDLGGEVASAQPFSPSASEALGKSSHVFLQNRDPVSSGDEWDKDIPSSDGEFDERYRSELRAAKTAQHFSTLRHRVSANFGKVGQQLKEVVDEAKTAPSLLKHFAKR